MDGHGAPTGSLAQVCRADLRCHSTASQESKRGVQRAPGLPERATPTQEVYELAKRGMDLATISDHDTIAGMLTLAEVIAVAEGGPLSLIAHRCSGLLRTAPAIALACAAAELAASPRLREGLGRGRLAVVMSERTWKRALQRLGHGYRVLLTARDSTQVARAA
jgi:hypothetical protein